jgi:hypothetical protein
MVKDLKRYFIELQPVEGETVPRHQETAKRRELAAQFLKNVGLWLHQHEMADKVSEMAITALGQVQMTCVPDVINHIRHYDDLNIANIRQGAVPVELQPRWNEMG